MSDDVRPFTIDVPESVLDDLRVRLAHTRWPDRENVDDWSQGIPLAYVREVVAYWAGEYDWRRREAALNRFEQYITTIDDVDSPPPPRAKRQHRASKVTKKKAKRAHLSKKRAGSRRDARPRTRNEKARALARALGS